MLSINTIIQVLFILTFPWVVIQAAKRFKILNWLSPVVLCYVAGIILGNLPGVQIDASASMQVAEIVIPLAIALLLFPTEFIKWLNGAGKTILSFVFCIIAVVVSVTLATFVFSDKMDEVAKAAGMMIGVYTGGTPNMSAIGLALEVKKETLILLNTADIVVTGIYLYY